MKQHKCARPGCPKMIPLKLYACKGHWFSLPESLRTSLWRAYESGDAIAHGHASIRAKQFWNAPQNQTQLFAQERNDPANK